MTKRITREDCEAQLREIGETLDIPLLDDYATWDETPGNAIAIFSSQPDSQIRARVLTKDGRDPFGSENCLTWRELYEKLVYALWTITVVRNLGKGDFSDYQKGF